jgi:ubiquinone/menaquinone biosynthesis C-methylase UbiE
MAQFPAAVSYFSLSHRVPEASAVDPRALARLYALITRFPVVGSTYRRFLEGVQAQGVTDGCGLDLGTGPGQVAVQMAHRRPGLSMVGLDLAAHMVVQARRRGVRAGLDGRALWPQGDGHRLPFVNHSFDLVVSSFALHHWDDPLQVLNEMARVLAPGGRYYIADLCREVSPAQRLFAYATIPTLSLAFGSYRGYGGYYESVRAAFSRDEATQLLARSDLPPGQVWLDSTWLVPVLVMSSPGSSAISKRQSGVRE